MEVTQQDLNTGWRVTDVAKPGDSPTTKLPWLPAEVPGHVHLDLHRAGVIPDPLARLHERDVAWVDETDWVYETTFPVDVPPAHAFLVFHGLDTVAEITLNGELLGRTDNMFIPHEFPVGGRLLAGENTLRVTFAAALRVGRERQAAWDAGGNDTLPYHWNNWAERAFVRKAQYMYGWDWGPELRGCGLWQGVELVTVPVARITDAKYDYEFTDENTVRVGVSVTVDRVQASEGLLLNLMFGGFRSVHVAVPAGVGQHQLEVTLPDMRITRWSPTGLGVAARYSLSLNLATSNDWGDRSPSASIYERQTHRCGFRTVELIRELDADGTGEGFKFRVNGRDLFIKGANWIPDSPFPGRITREQLKQRITQAREAGFNMLRVWGGGLYESEDFYDLCDENGILVWQDFPYACSYYPDTGEYAEAARAEATAAVRRLRNHPCLALWCGNNENQMMFDYDWTGTRPTRLLGDHLYHEILPSVLAAEDTQTPYWPTSPWGGPAGDCNSADAGDCHNWDVWHGRGDWVHYTENDSRFCSEFGFASSCGLAAWDKCLAPEDKHPHSPAVRWHDKTRKGYDTYLGYIALHYPAPQTLEDLVYYSQCNQADALKFGVEHYRRRKGRNWGTLFWQINDCWPTQSWAVIDSEGEPKAAYFACQRFYAPVLLSLVRDGEMVTAHLVNDRLTPLAGTLTFTLATFDGATVAEQSGTVEVGANAAASVASFLVTGSTGQERDVYLYARFVSDDGEQTADNYLFFAEPKDLRLADPGLSVTVEADDDADGCTITVMAQRFAPYVWLRRSDNVPLVGLSDNFFPLKPGETRTVSVDGDGLTPDALRGLLMVRSR